MEEMVEMVHWLANDGWCEREANAHVLTGTMLGTPKSLVERGFMFPTGESGGKQQVRKTS
jgi:hypothetical protein